MNRSELADRIAIGNGLSRREAKRWLDTVLSALSQAIGDGSRVSLSGFGTFEIHQRREKRGRNPHTGETLMLPPWKTVVFKPSSSLRSSLGVAGAPAGAEEAARLEGEPRQPQRVERRKTERPV